MVKSQRLIKSILIGILLVSAASVNANAVQTRHTNEDVTAYTARPDAMTASGTRVQYNYVGVHYQNGNPRNPVIPFGAVITTDNYI